MKHSVDMYIRIGEAIGYARGDPRAVYVLKNALDVLVSQESGFDQEKAERIAERARRVINEGDGPGSE